MSPKAQLAVVDSSYPADFAAVSNRRAHERLTPSALSWLNEVRLKYGPAVSVIDLSAGGAQIETTCHRLEPGRIVVIEMMVEDRELSIPSRVVRSGVSRIVPHITYRGAVEFKNRLPLPLRANSGPFDLGRSALRDRATLAPPVARLAIDNAAAPILDHLAAKEAAALACPPIAPHGKLYGWHRLVVRYRDGRMLKGFGRDFHPAKGQVHIWPAIDAPAQARISVQLGHLKAVFFVHDFDGGTTVEPEDSLLNAGRRILLTFVDGEKLDGKTLNYAADAPGFFVTPLDPTTNNERIFVVNRAVNHVQFL